MLQLTRIVLFPLAVLTAHALRAEVVIEWVTVEDTGNTGELSGTGAGGYGPDRICGAVDYEYRIGKYEVTNGQYIEFLNAVATTDDLHHLYDTRMSETYGGIVRTGTGTRVDPYVYTLKNPDTEPFWGSKPVNFVSFFDAARFANWLHNGQPSGDQDETTTEDGAYDLSDEFEVVRNDDAHVFVPTEDEWYKAAYYKRGGPDAGYWDYATRSDAVPASEPPPGTDLVNGSANYWYGQYAVGAPYYVTAGGAYTSKPSTSEYGTFDQTGNLREWTETQGISHGYKRAIRGGGFYDVLAYIAAAYRIEEAPDGSGKNRGIRLASPAFTADLDQDGDVDLVDFASFQMQFRGPWRR
jgi:formylglycine-generating enzyme required for sulfatase activity